MGHINKLQMFYCNNFKNKYFADSKASFASFQMQALQVSGTLTELKGIRIPFKTPVSEPVYG